MSRSMSDLQSYLFITMEIPAITSNCDIDVIYTNLFLVMKQTSLFHGIVIFFTVNYS